MGPGAVPNHLLQEGADRRPLLLHRHAVHGILERGQHLRQEIKLNVRQNVIGGQLLQLVQAPLESLTLVVQLVDLPDDIAFRGGPGRLAQGGYQVFDRVIVGGNAGLNFGDFLVIALPVARQDSLAVFKLLEEVGTIFAQGF